MPAESRTRKATSTTKKRSVSRAAKGAKAKAAPATKKGPAKAADTPPDWAKAVRYTPRDLRG